MPNYVLFGAMLVPTGVAMMMFMTSANTTVQLAAGPALRGGVLAVYMLVLLGTTPIGAPIMGLLAAHYGARSSLVAGGLMSFTAALVAIVYLMRRRCLTPRALFASRDHGHAESPGLVTVDVTSAAN